MKLSFYETFADETVDRSQNVDEFFAFRPDVDEFVPPSFAGHRCRLLQESVSAARWVPRVEHVPVSFWRLDSPAV